MASFTTATTTDDLFENRVLLLDGEVTQETCMQLISYLLLLEREDAETPITLVVSSPGGSVPAGLALIDVMADLTCPVRTVALGMVASMGSLIVACGDRRAAYPHAEIMVHQVLGGTGPGMLQQTDMEIEAEHLKRVRAVTDGLLAKRSKLSVEEVHELTERDRWLSAEEALGYGFIDEILWPAQKK